MDQDRLEKLAALAGLSLEGVDRQRLEREISALEGLAATLPLLTEEETSGVGDPSPILEREPAKMDRRLAEKNSPTREEGFFVIPGTPKGLDDA